MISDVLLALATMAAGSETIVVRKVDGSRLEVTRIGIDPASGAALSLADRGVVSCPLGELVSVEFCARPGAPGASPAAAVALHDGSRLVGTIRGGDPERLELELARGGSLSIPVDAIRAVFAGPRSGTLDVGRFAATGGDSLHRRPEAGGDATSGTVVAFGADAVRFEYSLGAADFPWDEIEAVVLAQQVEIDGPGAPIVDVDLRPDGSLRGTLVRLTERELLLKPAGFAAVAGLPLDGVHGLRFRSVGHCWLSDLAPTRVSQHPFLGREEQFLFPWKADRSVTGGPLQVHGRRYAKGFGCHSRTVLQFALDGRFSRFEAEAGVSDEVLDLPDFGAIEFRVLVDGQEKWKSRMVRGGEPAEPVGPIALAGAKSLELVTDFGAGEDVADRGVWGAPLLLR